MPKNNNSLSAELKHWPYPQGLQLYSLTVALACRSRFLVDAIVSWRMCFNVSICWLSGRQSTRPGIALWQPNMCFAWSNSKYIQQLLQNTERLEGKLFQSLLSEIMHILVSIFFITKVWEHSNALQCPYTKLDSWAELNICESQIVLLFWPSPKNQIIYSKA